MKMGELWIRVGGYGSYELFEGYVWRFKKEEHEFEEQTEVREIFWKFEDVVFSYLLHVLYLLYHEM